ncbi:hypothetical protein [Cellulosimicrobium sp. 22601]|uniref:hypothetical protein n=1 Tax=unclassified Cellulosimicrobium TaxID=2624466 RepID=UPI003F857B2C
MNIVVRIADRILQKVAPSATAQAACTVTRTTQCLSTICGSMGRRTQRIAYRDSCTGQTTYAFPCSC